MLLWTPAQLPTVDVVRLRLRPWTPPLAAAASVILLVAVAVGTMAGSGGLLAGVTKSSGPALTISPSSAASGAIVQLSGSGLPHRARLQVAWDAMTTDMPVVTTNGSGAFRAQLQVPASPSGRHDVSVGAATTGLSAVAAMTLVDVAFTVTDPVSGSAGSSIFASPDASADAGGGPTPQPSASDTPSADPTLGPTGDPSGAPSPDASPAPSPPRRPRLGPRRPRRPRQPRRPWRTRSTTSSTGPASAPTGSATSTAAARWPAMTRR